MKRYVSIDRFEGETAVCFDDNQNKFEIKRSELPQGCKEGDVLYREGKRFEIDAKETDKRKKEAEELLRALME